MIRYYVCCDRENCLHDRLSPLLLNTIWGSRQRHDSHRTTTVMPVSPAHASSNAQIADYSPTSRPT